MSSLRRSLAEYLALRRALGYGLAEAERLLGQFLDYMQEHSAETITTEHALAWATLPHRGDAWHSLRMQAVRGFARYLHSVDPVHEVPPAFLLPDPPHRATPYLYPDAEIAALMDAAGTLSTAHRAATYRTLIGLLAVTGMRIGEAVRLDREHLGANGGVLVVAETKFGKSRELPLHESTTEALRRYLRRRDRPRAATPTTALFVSQAGTRLYTQNAWTTFAMLRDHAGIKPRSAVCRPRIHDIRHTFAVNTLLDAYRSGEEVGPKLALLSTYMGHVNPAKTYWYLQAAPELMALAGERLERHLGKGGRR
jgi:integrase/recombinase XerD